MKNYSSNLIIILALNTFITHLFYGQHSYFMLIFQNSQWNRFLTYSWFAIALSLKINSHKCSFHMLKILKSLNKWEEQWERCLSCSKKCSQKENPPFLQSLACTAPLCKRKSLKYHSYIKTQLRSKSTYWLHAILTASLIFMNEVFSLLNAPCKSSFFL